MTTILAVSTSEPETVNENPLHGASLSFREERRFHVIYSAWVMVRT